MSIYLLLPHLPCRHLPKLFDNIHGRHFEAGPDGQLSDRAIAMVSAEGEVVPFAEPCDCTGAVEVWCWEFLQF